MGRVIVFGDACVDRFVYGACPRLCPEAPVPVFVPQHTVTNDGMALNVVRNIRAIDSSLLVSAVVNDKTLITKTRYVESQLNHILLRLDEERTVHPYVPDEQLILPLKPHDTLVAVVSDYNKGFITEENAAFISRLYPVSFLDTKKPLGPWCEGFTFIKINRPEHERTKSTITDTLRSKLIVTLGGDGCVFQGQTYAPKQTSSVVNVCGAGDSFLAGFVVSYLRTKDVPRSLCAAMDCAGSVIQQRGVAVPFAV